MGGLAQVNLRLETARFLSAKMPGSRIIPACNLENAQDEMLRELAEGLGRLTQKRIPSLYFYDPMGSVLYEQITHLPEYYLTRCEVEILRHRAPQMACMLHAPIMTSTLVALGSNPTDTTQILLDAWGAQHAPVTYIPIDLSEDRLSSTASALCARYPYLQVIALAGYYENCLELLTPGKERLYLCLGGSIGNFSRGVQNIFFMKLLERMGAGDKLLIGFDRVPHDKKSVQVIEKAYNDEAQVTASFNRNILSHLNKAVGANFRLSTWQHEAIYNQEEQRIEMYLESTRFQRVQIEHLGKTFVFEPGEKILTEISRKFVPDELADWFEALGYRCLASWTDASEYYGMLLLEA